MNNPLIRLNFDSPESIKNLYGIGSVLAERIVEHRNKHGYINSPEQLAEVEGISLDLAITLAPHIDWSCPQQIETEKEIDWAAVLVGTSIFLGGFLYASQFFQPLLISISYYKLGYQDAWVLVWISGSIFLSFISLRLIGIALIISALTKNIQWATKIGRIALFAGMLYILAAISSGLGNVVHYQFYSVNGWLDFINNRGAISGLISFVVICIFFGPLVIFWLAPSPQIKVRLAKIFDASLFLSAILAVVMPLLPNKTGIAEIVLSLFGGGVYLSIGISSIRSGNSAFFGILKWFNFQEVGILSDSSYWLTWLNSRLPNTEQQRALKQALDKAYPASRARTVFSVILVGVGSWIIITAANSLFDWLLQGWLNKMFPWFR